MTTRRCAAQIGTAHILTPLPPTPPLFPSPALSRSPLASPQLADEMPSGEANGIRITLIGYDDDPTVRGADRNSTHLNSTPPDTSPLPLPGALPIAAGEPAARRRDAQRRGERHPHHAARLR